MSARVVVLAAPLALCAGLAFAADDGASHGPSWKMLALHMLNFAFLLYLLNRFARAPILDYLARRSRGIRQELESAQARLREAETELESLRERVASFDAEAQRMALQAEDLAQAEKARAVSRAHESALRLREDAQRVGQQEIERARNELRAEAAQLATALAADILREKLTADDDKRLVDEFIERIGAPE